MSAVQPPPIPAPRLDASPPSQSRLLRRLFLTLFLRGRSSRGLKKERAPKSVGQKLALTLFMYVVLGLLAFSFIHQSVFVLAVSLHAMTFIFLGMFVGSSAGDILFSTDEADILLHRPVLPTQLLWAKIWVMVEVSLWMAFAFNLAGLGVGVLACSNGGWRFLPAHVVSTILEALFSTGCVVMVYQLCLRWFGRERLDGLMTITQIAVSIGAVLCGQLLPQLLPRVNSILTFNEKTWWIALIPPAWFAGFDDAIAGSGALSSWLLAACAAVSTAFVLWIVFAKLARDYEAGLQRLSEHVARRPKHADRRRWLDTLISVPPLSWWLRNPVSRASFLLTAAYLFRDRDVKLRVYPGLAPFLVLPLVFLLQELNGRSPIGEFGVVFMGGYLGVIPLLGVTLMQYSQGWQASDVFRVAPVAGPAMLCDGARRAVMLLLVVPLVIAMALLLWLIHRNFGELLMLLPGVLLLPVFALAPNLGGRAVPLSQPVEDAKSAGRGMVMILAIFVSVGISGIAYWAKTMGWFWGLIGVEGAIVLGIYAAMRWSIGAARWPSME